MGFQRRVVFGELIDCWTQHCLFHLTPSKSSSVLAKHHWCQPLEGLTKCLQIAKSWGIKRRRLSNKVLNNPPDSDCQEPAPLQEAIQESTVNISQPKLMGFFDASHGSELWKPRSITGHVLTFLRGAIACKSKTQTVAASDSKFVAAFTAAKAAWCLRCILQELGFPQEGPTETHTDNKAASQIINDNQAPTIQTRHTDISFFSRKTSGNNGPFSWSTLQEFSIHQTT